MNKEEAPHSIKEFTLQDIMMLSRDLELIQEDIDMMNHFLHPGDEPISKKKC